METDTKLAFLNTLTYHIFSPPTYFNPAFILRFYISFILLLTTALYILLFTNLPRIDKPHTLRDAVTDSSRDQTCFYISCRLTQMFTLMLGLSDILALNF